MNLLFSALHWMVRIGAEPGLGGLPGANATPVTLPSPFSQIASIRYCQPLSGPPGDCKHLSSLSGPLYLVLCFYPILSVYLEGSALSPFCFCTPRLFQPKSLHSQLFLWRVHKIFQTCHLLHEAKVRLRIINSIQRSQNQAYFQSYPTLLGYELI